MDFSKRKYIVFKKDLPNNSITLNSVYITSIYKRVKDWGCVKFQNNQISEIIEYNKVKCYIQDVFYDEFYKFALGRSPLLIEKFNNRSSNERILIERQELPESIYVPVSLKLEKIIMSNGNSYITTVI